MSTETTAKNPVVVAVPLPPDLARLHELCKLHAISSRELAVERASLEQEYTAMINRRAPYILEMEEAFKRTLAGIEELVRQHPEWLGEKRSLKTPLGTIKLISSSSLSIADEEVTLTRLFLRGKRVQGFDPADFYRENPTLIKEALEKLDDKTLEKLGVVRFVSDNFSFKLAAVDLKKALADSVPAPVPAAA